MANNPIHGITGEGLHTPAAAVIETIYIWVIILVIGGMVLHWTLDLGHSLLQLFRRKPKIRRMRWNEVWQHTLLMVSFIVLVVSGFALRFSESWISTWFFGWEGGFELRGTVHRFAAVVFMFTVVWHILFIFLSHRGRMYFKDMMPNKEDILQFWQKIMYNLGRRPDPPQFGRFSYVEKAEYWALIWGTAVMVVTGLMLWFDNWFIQLIPKGALDIALVVHYWEAWLATLAILVWHMYSTVFSPHVYPMNPSWITGTMPEDMYKHEHPAYFEQAKRETQRMVKEDIEGLALNNGKDESNNKTSDH
jgi:formate dehydrogenase gamma subunit